MEIPLSVILEQAKKDYVDAINEVNMKCSLPASLIELILVGILADIREKKNAELQAAYQSMNEPENKAEVVEQPQEEL